MFIFLSIFHSHLTPVSIKTLIVSYGSSFSNWLSFTMLETEVFKCNFLNFYIAKTMLRILLKFVQLTLNK